MRLHALRGAVMVMAPAAIVVPFDYTALIWATGLGWLVWGDVPMLWTILGAAIIVVGEIIIIL